MYFTKEDFKKIEQWLKRNSVKDTEFPKATLLEGLETILIVQNGENKNTTISKLLEYFNGKLDGSGLAQGKGISSVILVGGNAEAEGNISISLGKETKTSKEGEAAFGKFNNSDSSTLFSVGIGESNTERKNAFEITKDGHIYINSVGGYNEDKYPIEDLATVLNKKLDTDNVATINGISITNGGNINIENGPTPFVEITHLELKELRDSSQLIPGSFYKITDYTTEVEQIGASQAGHLFDVVVLALSESELSERAWAIHSERDTEGYFSNSKLEAWQIWYCLDNDTTRFSWADTENGTGVIYRMIDEFGNDCPYDFKNVKFRDPRTTSGEIKYYTFTAEDGSDFSLNKKCHDNTIQPAHADIEGGGFVQWLAYNIFNINQNAQSTLSGNRIGNDCWNNLFGANSKENVIGTNCSQNVLGDNCYCNKFDNRCYRNTLGNNCHDNTFAVECNDNILGDVNYNNYFGIGCFENVLKKNCDNNIFETQCHKNTMGIDCYYNLLGISCRQNHLGDGSIRNNFGARCFNNSFGLDCASNSLGNDCHDNSFGEQWISNTLGNSVAMCDNSKHHFVRWCTFSNGCYQIKFNNAETASTNMQIQSYVFVNGLTIRNTASTISVVRNRNYETRCGRGSTGSITTEVIGE